MGLRIGCFFQSQLLLLFLSLLLGCQLHHLLVVLARLFFFSPALDDEDFVLLDLLIESSLGVHHVFEHAKVIDRVVLIERLNFL